jgi:hypothetical protein
MASRSRLTVANAARDATLQGDDSNPNWRRRHPKSIAEAGEPAE